MTKVVFFLILSSTAFAGLGNEECRTLIESGFFVNGDKIFPPQGYEFLNNNVVALSDASGVAIWSDGGHVKTIGNSCSTTSKETSKDLVAGWIRNSVKSLSAYLQKPYTQKTPGVLDGPAEKKEAQERREAQATLTRKLRTCLNYAKWPVEYKAAAMEALSVDNPTAPSNAAQ
jgi:hypothetical protein